MTTLLLIPLALAMLGGAEEIPSWVNELGPGAPEFWSRASARGVHEDCVRPLMQELDDYALRRKRFAEHSECWRASGVDLLDFLRETIESGVLPLGTFPYAPRISQLRVLRLLASFADSVAADWVISHVRKEFDRPMGSRDDVGYRCGLLRWPLVSLRSKEAVDFLIEVQAEAFWSDEESPRVNMELLQNTDYISTPEQENAMAVGQIREVALIAIGEVGTEYAVDILATSEDIESQGSRRDSAFRDAVRRSVGIYRYIEDYGGQLSEEKLAEIQEIYSRYGKTYEPVLPREGYETLSPPHF